MLLRAPAASLRRCRCTFTACDSLGEIRTPCIGIGWMWEQTDKIGSVYALNAMAPERTKKNAFKIEIKTIWKPTKCVYCCAMCVGECDSGCRATFAKECPQQKHSRTELMAFVVWLRWISVAYLSFGLINSINTNRTSDHQASGTNTPIQRRMNEASTSLRLQEKFVFTKQFIALAAKHVFLII